MQLQFYGKKIWVYRQPIDFRCSIDGLTHLVHHNIQKNAQEGIYIFFNRHKDKIKCLSWHKNGFVLLYKRLERGRFCFIQDKGVMEITSNELSWLLAGLEWHKMRHWNELDYGKLGEVQTNLQ